MNYNLEVVINKDYLETKMSIDYKLKDETPILEANKGRFVQVETNSKDENSLIRKVFKALVEDKVITVGFTRKKDKNFVGITNGVNAKNYENGERMPGIERIKNQKVLQALRTLP
ncbi:MAG: hypothetical protein L6266_03025, partial [Nanoarchaeota archaeon]|nr:hypothetical protein [Nanoarchaeota archaeon]